MSANPISGLLRRVLRRGHNATTPSQQTQIESLGDEVHGDVEVLEAYGLSTVPPAAVTEGLAAFLNGQSDHGVLLGWFDKTYRPADLQPGETCLYDFNGSRILLNKDGEITLTDKSGSSIKLLQNGDVVISPSSNNLIINANVQVNGGVTASADVVAGSVSLQSHVHGGVRPGPANTSPPL